MTMTRNPWIALIMLAVTVPACGPPAKPETYATRALRTKLTEERLREEDDGERAPGAVEHALKLRALYTRVAKSMPTDPEGQRLLEEAAKWFKKDVIEIWMGCRTTTQMLAKAKPPIKEDPRRILEAAVEIMRRLNGRLTRTEGIRGFARRYEYVRKGETWKGGPQLSHQETVDRLYEVLKPQPKVDE
jgi:hypothetical protein